MMLQGEFKLLIDGKFVDGDSTMNVINPATGQPATTTCSRASEAQLNQTVVAANASFPAWSATPLADRKAMRSFVMSPTEQKSSTKSNSARCFRSSLITPSKRPLRWRTTLSSA
ncbi:MAG: Gamma-aminobutyraldehyde dehydrogenase [Verrucomicrobia subdivision 3 bacterium]|nr:Gamma-aminobutyraldehyde dehydrogenase [Limisphaerales bacterium]